MTQKKNWLQIYLEYAAAVILLWLLRVLPLTPANIIARLAVRLLDFVVPKLRRIAGINLAFAFPELAPEKRDELINGVFQSLARLLVAFARFPGFNQSNIGKWISYEGLEHYLEAKTCGHGVLVATAHLGNWEFSAFAHALMTEPMNVMIRPLDNPLIDGLVARRRTLSGNRLINKREAARSVVKALRNNEAVGVLIDQNTAADEGVFIEFFGKLACAGTGFVKLAYHSQAPVIPGFALWDEAQGRYILRFYPKVELTGDLLEDSQRIHSRFEEIIRQYPDQWMWIHRRWKTRPLREPALY